jgi:hypothetical protein
MEGEFAGEARGKAEGKLEDMQEVFALLEQGVSLADTKKKLGCYFGRSA